MNARVTQWFSVSSGIQLCGRKQTGKFKMVIPFLGLILHCCTVPLPFHDGPLIDGKGKATYSTEMTMRFMYWRGLRIFWSDQKFQTTARAAAPEWWQPTHRTPILFTKWLQNPEHLILFLRVDNSNCQSVTVSHCTLLCSSHCWLKCLQDDGAYAVGFTHSLRASCYVSSERKSKSQQF